MPKYRTEIYREDGETETTIEVVANYSTGSDDYFDKGFGNYLPGDPPDWELLSAKDEQGNDVKLTKEEEQILSNTINELRMGYVKVAG